MILFVVAMTMQGADPGPIDAFRANYAASKVEMDYHYRCGFAAASALAPGRLWSTRDLVLEEHPEFELEGRWSCDGLAEAYRHGAPASIAAEGRKALAKETKAGRVKLTYTPSYEGIYDGEILTEHYFDEQIFPSELSIFPVTDPPATIAGGCGPFSWWPSGPFPSLLKAVFPSITPTRGKSSRDGRALETEVYRLVHDGYWTQLEISYDASVGYLPRFARLVAAAGPAATVHEFYLIDAKLCVAGGFVPTEWYSTTLSFDSFTSDYPAYSPETVVVPRRNSFVGHFKASTFVDRSRPVEMDRLAEVTVINAPGGQVRLGHNPRSLTLADVKAVVGPKLLESSESSLPTLDAAELNELEAEPRGYWPIYLGILAAIALGAFGLRRRHRGLTALLIVACLPGCGRVGEPVAKVSATFLETPKLYDLNDPIMPARLVVRNDGNVPLRLINGDGGCACREVDRSSFPLVIKPGEELAVTVKISHGRMSTPQVLPFTFETDQGTLGTTAPLYALPKHQLSPESPSAMLVEGNSGWSIDLIHRSIRKDGEPNEEVELIIPPEFELVSIAVKEGPIAGSFGYKYEDKKYRMDLRDNKLGLHKAAFRLVGRGQAPLAEASASWRRVPFLSSVPESLAIGGRPMRVFLRCSDEAVELTKVLEAPAGISAVLSSPREVTVRVVEGAPDSIRGEVVVATTAKDRPPLKIPIVRYSPAASR